MAALILIVEDYPASLELAKYLIDAHGYSTLTATDGGEGIRIVRDARPDLVLCDLQLPVLDGYGVLTEIRDDPALRGTLVVAVTAFSMPSDSSKALAAGFDGYISKPINPESFVQEVEALLRSDLLVARPSQGR